jgi:hypothetical protein
MLDTILTGMEYQMNIRIIIGFAESTYNPGRKDDVARNLPD